MWTAPSHRHDRPQLLPPSSTIEAAHRRCALPHPTPQPLSAAAVHSCCVPSLPPPPLPSSTIEAAHRWCALPHPTPQPPSAATAAAIVPQPPSTLPPSTVAVRRCCRRCRCRHPNPLYRSAAASAALGISTKIGKAHLLFCSPSAIRSWGGGGGCHRKNPTNYHARNAQPC